MLLPECDTAGLQGGIQGAVSLPHLFPSWVAQLRVCVPGCAMKGLVCDWAAPKSRLGFLPCTVCSTHVLLVKVPEELFPPNFSLYTKEAHEFWQWESRGKVDGAFFPSCVNRASWITNEDSYRPKKH